MIMQRAEKSRTGASAKPDTITALPFSPLSLPPSPSLPLVTDTPLPVADPKISKRGRGRKTMYQPRRHLSQMHTTNYMPFIRYRQLVARKKSEPIRGLPTGAPWIRHCRLQLPFCPCSKFLNPAPLSPIVFRKTSLTATRSSSCYTGRWTKSLQLVTS